MNKLNSKTQEVDEHSVLVQEATIEASGSAAQCTYEYFADIDYNWRQKFVLLYEADLNAGKHYWIY